MFAGVGKADWEINLGLDNHIFCFNVESAAELEVLNSLAEAKNQIADIALRINPEVDAHTHGELIRIEFYDDRQVNQFLH